MSRGKHICKELKAVRKRIAEENGIPLEIPECTYHGPCKGTCPRCESEVQFLENELAKRIKLGKVAKVAGLALTLGAAGTATAQVAPNNKGIMLDAVNIEAEKVPTIETYDMPGAIVITQDSHVRLTGVVTDSKTNEPLPFVNVEVLGDDGKVIQGTTTDFDGKYDIYLLEGVYMIRTSYVGYHQFIRTDVRMRPTWTTIVNIAMTASDERIEEVIIGMMEKVPHIEIGPEGNMNTEIQGVPLRIQY